MKITSSRHPAGKQAQPTKNNDSELIELATIRACAESPEFFVENFCCSRYNPRSTVLFDFAQREYLKRTLEVVSSHRGAIVKHPRAARMTTTMIAYALWTAIFKENQHVVIGSVTFQQAKHMRDTLMQLVEGLPRCLSPQLHDHKMHVQFGNGSSISFTAVTETFCRGTVPALVYLDNFASVDQGLQAWVLGNILPSLGADAKLVIASTPAPTANCFDWLWNQAVKGYGILQPVNITFSDLPYAQQAQLLQQQDLVSAEQWKREALATLSNTART